MAAHWSAMVLAVQLLLAAALAIMLLRGSGLSGAPVAALVLVELCGVALLLATAPLALGRSMTSARPPRGRLRDLLRALFTDALALEVLLARMAVEPCRASPDIAPGAGRLPLRPVLLIHGFGCSRAVWRPLLARLRAAGIGPVRALSLEPLLAGIETHAGEVLGELETLGSRGGGCAITIVAHSMGGLLARAVLRAARPGLIGRIITIGAPHHGTALACLFGWPNALQMRPGSRWLEDLNRCQEGQLGVPVTTLYSLDDNYIVPAGSARLRGAQAIELRGLGHLGLLHSRRALEHVLSAVLA
jgi:PGAP1-like protein